MLSAPTPEQRRSLIQQRLAGLELRALHQPELRRAAVALAVVDAGHGADLDGLPVLAQWSEASALLLTRRATTMREHPGQWALPGGRIDAGETPEEAAVRELHEELGLRVDASQVLGRLDDYATRSGYVITPVVVWAGAARDLLINPHEVMSVHRIPASELLRGDAPILNDIPQSTQPVLRMPVGSGWIAAPTAAVLYQYRELCLCGRAPRVAHFEQPVFAWR